MTKHQMWAKLTCLFLFLTAPLSSTKGQGNELPPKIISIFKTEYFYPRNSTLTSVAFINCTAQNGHIQYEWRKDGVVVQNSQLIDNSTGILKFVKMQNEDYGTYQCFATNDYGTSVSKPIKIKEASLESFPNNNIQEVQCKQFKHCKVKCQNKPLCVPDSQCEVRWKIEDETESYVQINKRVALDNHGDLHFLWTNVNDWTGLRYICEVWHKRLKKSVVGSQTSLKIENAPKASELEPFSVFTESGKALVGGKGELRCMFSGYPLPEIEWIDPKNTTIKDNPGKYEISDFGRVLTIINAEQDDEGFYSCIGKAKTESSPQRVFLNVTSAPILSDDDEMHDKVLVVGSQAIFRCEVESLSGKMPASQPLWKINGVDLEFDTGKFILRENNQVLIVTNVEKSDTGVYQCMSENSEGVLLEEAILKVIDPITISQPPQNSYDIMIGDVLEVVIIAVTDPAFILQYKWMLMKNQNSNRTEIQSNEYWNISWPIRNKLTIDARNVPASILDSLTGYYTVKVYNNIDQKLLNFTVNLSLANKMETDIIPGVEIGISLAIFVFIIVIVIFCCLRKRKRNRKEKGPEKEKKKMLTNKRNPPNKTSRR